MKYDFDGITPRRGTNSCKWDTSQEDGVLPMWVADMDFKTAPAIINALRERVEHGIFGYTKVPQAYYDAVTGWFSERHGWKTKAEWIIYTSGVVPALSAIIKAMTEPGDKVIIQTPAYNCFYSSIRNNGCKLSSNRLINSNGKYSIDFEDLEDKAKDPKAKLMILCNPHNPTGRVWTLEELTRIGDICLRHNVFIIADEIHCELTYGEHKYIPFASISEEFQKNSVTCVSPSKAFNIAGLQIANIIAPDADIRERINRAININEVCDVNPFGVLATIAAYNESGEWLDSLREYIHANYLYLQEWFTKYLPELRITPLEGTYLVWIDCRTTIESSCEIACRLEKEHKVKVNPGTMYGPEGEGFIRLNIACPRSMLEEGLHRILSAFRPEE